MPSALGGQGWYAWVWPSVPSNEVLEVESLGKFRSKPPTYMSACRMMPIEGSLGDCGPARRRMIPRARVRGHAAIETSKPRNLETLGLRYIVVRRYIVSYRRPTVPALLGVQP